MARLLSWGGSLVEVQGAGRRAGGETRMASGHGMWAVTDDHSPEEDQLSAGLNKDMGGGVGGYHRSTRHLNPRLLEHGCLQSVGLCQAPQNTSANTFTSGCDVTSPQETASQLENVTIRRPRTGAVLT